MSDHALSTDRVTQNEFRSIAADSGQPVGEAFAVHGLADVEAACAAAEAAFDEYRALDRENRAQFLERIGEEILAIGDPVIDATRRDQEQPGNSGDPPRPFSHRGLPARSIWHQRNHSPQGGV